MTIIWPLYIIHGKLSLIKVDKIHDPSWLHWHVFIKQDALMANHRYATHRSLSLPANRTVTGFESSDSPSPLPP